MTIDKSRLDGLLFAMLGSNTLVQRWWTRPNKAFDMQTPESVYTKDPERVRDHIFTCVGR